MKKVLIVTGIYEPDIGGPASYAKNLANNLSDRFEFKIITYSSVRKFSSDKTSKAPVLRIWKKWPWPIKHLIFILKVLSQAKKFHIIYSLSTINGGISSLLAAKLFRKKFFIRVVGDYAWQVAAEKNKTRLLIDDFQKAKKSGWIGFLFWMQGYLCKKADKIIVPSEYIKNLVIGWGVSQEKITVIYNSVDFSPAFISKEEARKIIGIHGNILISVGRLAPWKGFKMLIKIMPKLLEINQFFRLVIVGEGPDKNNLNLIIKNLGLDKKVYMVGKKSQDELAVYLAASDIFILNSGYEGFSHQLLEAMVSGVPVIASAVLGNREMITQGENGFLVKYNDEFNLIEAIKTLHKDPELKEQFIIEGKKTLDKFSLNKMLSEISKQLNQ